MFGFFKKKAVADQKAKQRVVSFSSKKQAYFEGHYLYYFNKGELLRVDLSKLQYAYCDKYQDSLRLLLFDYHQNYIEVTPMILQEIYPVLSKKFGFDDSVFYQVLDSQKDLKKRIWLKEEPENYQVLKVGTSDIYSGFTVLSKPEVFVLWDTTYKELVALNLGQSYVSDYKTVYYKFNYPVLIGNILVDNLHTSLDNKQQDIAVQSYYCKFYNKQNNQQSYYELKKSLEFLNPIVDKTGVYEREDQNYWTFDFKGIDITLLYTFDKGSGYDDGATNMYINNQRDYRDKLLKPLEDLNTQAIQVIDLDYLCEFHPDYKTNPLVCLAPKAIMDRNPDKSSIWLDKQQQTLGFRSKELAIVYNLADINRIIIQNVLPAKGAGYSYLVVEFIHEKQQVIFYAEQNGFDSYIKQIEAFELQVDIPMPYHNC
ncbi:hypothetical protein [Myroides sp. LJL119]